MIGESRNGSTRWLGVGSLSFQPAELAKIAVILYVSVLVEDNQDTIHTAKTFFRLPFTVLIPTALVAVENLSSGAIIGAVGICIMFIGGARLRYFFMAVAPLTAAVVLLVVLPIYVPTTSLPDPLRSLMESYTYRTERIWAWLDPWAYAQDEGYQAIQSLYAVGSGGSFGRGLGNSIQKLGFIPEAHNDIIFSIICEELGLFGAGIVILLFGVLIWHGIRISMTCLRKFTLSDGRGPDDADCRSDRYEHSGQYEFDAGYGEFPASVYQLRRLVDAVSDGQYGLAAQHFPPYSPDQGGLRRPPRRRRRWHVYLKIYRDSKQKALRRLTVWLLVFFLPFDSSARFVTAVCFRSRPLPLRVTSG